MTIVYRACSTGNQNKIRPIKDKAELVEKCFNSFLKAFNGVDYDLTVLLDKPTPRLRKLFKDYVVEETYYTNFNEGNVKSFHRQIDIALSKKSAQFLFIEDDYYFLPYSGKVIVNSNLPLFTPYDHPDYYFDKRHDYETKVVLAGNHHWRKVSATTLTFGGSTEFLTAEASFIKKFGWADYPMWLEITNRYNLYAPIPSLATHMETQYLSPVIYWNFA